ncbi:RNA-binding protein with serine-rich domain 1-like [Zalophus californianus]|uniref:RNA-binding protein with serine-rich domain 1-like n=1 Tax=Zalophus californianus TaxID=9704 RepID=A0A6J2DYL5_ZALCA|nr:RNA-binding protein with serine-rich domain 1-like [Zalophus californianus]
MGKIRALASAAEESRRRPRQWEDGSFSYQHTDHSDEKSKDHAKEKGAPTEWSEKDGNRDKTRKKQSPSRDGSSTRSRSSSTSSTSTGLSNASSSSSVSSCWGSSSMSYSSNSSSSSSSTSTSGCWHDKRWHSSSKSKPPKRDEKSFP